MTASQTPMHGTKGDIKARESSLGSTRSPRKPTLAKTADFANFAILTPRGDPVAPRWEGILGNQVA